jgi:hypothetical protein
LVYLLFPINLYAEDTFTFNSADVDKIIEWGEYYEPGKKALELCNEKLGILSDIEINLNSDIKSCEESGLKKDGIIKEQTENMKDINKKIESAVNEAKRDTFWSKVQWGGSGLSIGIIIGIILTFL